MNRPDLAAEAGLWLWGPDHLIHRWVPSVAYVTVCGRACGSWPLAGTAAPRCPVCFEAGP